MQCTPRISESAGHLDLVVVVEADELAEAKVAGERAGLGGDALLQAAVAADDVGEVVDDGKVRLVEGRREMRLGLRAGLPLAAALFRARKSHDACMAGVLE